MAGGILAIDQGTSSTKALLLDDQGRTVARASRPMRTHYPQQGWAEQDGEAIWTSVVEAIAEIVEAGHPVDGLAISNQRETIGLWDTDSQPVGPFVLWQCRRTSDVCQRLKPNEADIIARSGLAVDPMFSATKLAWLLDNAPDARNRANAGELKAGTVDSWLVWKLTGGVHATDHTNASRTQLMNLDTLDWDPELTRTFDVPLCVLPPIQSSASLFGHTVAGATALPAGVPIGAVMGDSHAALFGHGFDDAGGVKATCGTGSSLMAVTDQRVWSGHGLSSTIAWSTPAGARHALEGNILVSGQTLTFVSRLLGLENEQALLDLARTTPDSGGVVIVPALAGLGAPHWQAGAKGLVHGLTLASEPAHVARAAIEAIAFQIRDVFAAMEQDFGSAFPVLSVDGGAAANPDLLQFLADILGRPVRRPASLDLSALGAARMGAQQLGWPAAQETGGGDVFRPAIGADQRKALLDRWADAVSRSL